MCKRGVKFMFEPNELVLCFEPDPTKAKVLYYAKILDQCVGSKNSSGKRRAEYMIHFQGWNSSWDRIVPESFVLKNNESNRALMRRLAAIAREVKRNKTRKRRIDDILVRHFKRSRLHSESEESSDDDSDDETDENYDENDIDDEQDRQTNSDIRDEDDFDDRMKDSMDGSESEISQATVDTENDSENEDDDDEDDHEKEIQHIDLELPENLKIKLEDDCIAVRINQKFVKLPATPNVVTVLEGYVKNFGVNILCATGEKNRNANQPVPPERNINICKELVDGLRVIFDFTLPKILLYASEKDQYEKILREPPPTAKTEVKIKKEEIVSPVDPPVSPAVRSRPQRRSSQRLQTPPISSPKLPRLVPKSKEMQDSGSENDEGGNTTADEEEPRSRRITRHSYHEEMRKSGSKHDLMITNNNNISMSSTRGGSNKEVTSSTAEHEEAPTTRRRSSALCERVTPPPPLLIPSHISSQPTSSGPSLPATPDYTKEAAVNNIFSYKLIQNDYKADHVMPCMIYGAHHLLRLFVKLPDLLAEMRLPDQTLKHLLRHLEMFIDYLSSRSEELFPDSVYCET